MRMKKFRIESVESKRPDKPNRWHKRVTGKLCTIECLRVNWSATLRIAGLSPVASSTMFYTSTVVDANLNDDVLTIETVNSVYTLRMVDEP